VGFIVFGCWFAWWVVLAALSGAELMFGRDCDYLGSNFLFLPWAFFSDASCAAELRLLQDYIYIGFYYG
jgi:hypothetical protein